MLTRCTGLQVLTRPLPDYAIHHVFSQHGPVERVRLQSDTRYAVVEVRVFYSVLGATCARHHQHVYHTSALCSS